MLPIGLIWIAVPLAVAFFGVVLLLAGVGHLFRGRPAKATGRIVLGAPAALAGLAAGLLGFNVQTFARLTHEAPVADVRVKALDAKRDLYRVTVTRLDGPKMTQNCVIQGDEWDIGARVQKWKPWANVLGLDTTYRLDQVTNRYITAARGNGKPITACDLKGPPPAVDRWMPLGWLTWLRDHAYTEHRRFGSASFMPLADGAEYRVLITQSGLNAEPANAIAARANAARDVAHE
jgi:hypothetical protein